MALEFKSRFVRGLTGKCGVLACLALFSFGALPAQDLIQTASQDGSVRLVGADAAILESPENRKDLPCTVTPDKPLLGFDLKFHTHYEVSVPLKELAGTGNHLTMVFRVSPEDGSDDPVYFSQHYSVPAIDSDRSGPAFLEGVFDVGEGKYHIDWLMRDRAERMCSFHWDAEASLPPRDKQMPLNIAPGAVQPVDLQMFEPEAPIERQQDGALNIKVVLNFAPQDASSAAIQPADIDALLAILRYIAREPLVGQFSIVVYNLQEQRVFFRQDAASRIDFPALGQAVKSLRPGTVDLKQLEQKHGDTDFLADLMSKELIGAPDPPDALIFAGPKVMLDEGLSPDTLRQLSEAKFPVFYMNYSLDPQAYPWRDVIGSAVRFLKGTEFTISRPRDLFFAWTDILGRIVKSKVGRTATANANAVRQ